MNDHWGGVDSELVGRAPRAWGVCDCGWRGEKHTGDDAGFDAALDRQDHLLEKKSWLAADDAEVHRWRRER